MSETVKAILFSIAFIACVLTGTAFSLGYFSGPEVRAQMAAARAANEQSKHAFVLECITRASKPYGDNGRVVEECQDAGQRLF